MFSFVLSNHHIQTLVKCNGIDPKYFLFISSFSLLAETPFPPVMSEKCCRLAKKERTLKSFQTVHSVWSAKPRLSRAISVLFSGGGV